MKDNPCYYDAAFSHFSEFAPCLWSIVISLLLVWIPLIFRFLLCLMFLFVWVISIWSCPYGFILTENDVTLTLNQRIISVTPWEQLRWKVLEGRGISVYLVDEAGKEYHLSDRYWIAQAFLVRCPNPPAKEYYNEVYKGRAVLQWWKLGEKYILSPCQVRSRKTASSVLWYVTGVLVSFFFLGGYPLIEMDNVPDFLLIFWLSSIFIALVTMLGAEHIKDSVEHSVAAALYQKQQAST